ncbi:hypothetical protein N566_13210 [Streptomycetaceae bacterium MP113-05]|nr:hypothetical protein N566_13210 [Streptomycetaceae bacterium MP113-05]
MSEPPDRGRFAATPLPLWYRVPDGFHPIDLDEDSEERLEQTAQALARVYPSATREQLVATTLGFELTLAKAASAGVVFFSSFVLRTEEDEPVAGICQLSVAERPPGDPNLYPLNVLEAAAPPEQGVHQGIVELPGGPAAVTVAGHETSVPGVLFGVEGNVSSLVRTVTFQMAVPRSREAVTIFFATEDLEHDDEFLELATVFAAGVSFTQPPKPPSEEEVAAAERIQGDVRATFG